MAAVAPPPPPPFTENHEQDTYQVYLSFRGSDTRVGFVDHLCAALLRKQIQVFRDKELARGEDIGETIARVIRLSDLSIVIFSQNYPKSDWCLGELKQIHESKQMIVPIFYHVHPYDIQELKDTNWKGKFRDALMEVSELSGFEVNEYTNVETLVDAIVNDVSMKLSNTRPSNSFNIRLFGIDSFIHDVESLLSMELENDVRMVGIWGMEGIGKTTIVSKVFDRIRKKFDAHCFVSNVGDALSRNCGATFLRNKIICGLLGDQDIKMNSLCSIDDCIRRRLKHTKVLIVLDDVHTCTQLKSVLEDSGLYPNSFCPGSRIIVTSRDSLVFDNVNLKCDTYQTKQLKDDEALQLFCWHAFGQENTPQEYEYEKLSKQVVEYADYVPLALVVLGSELKHKTTSYWEDTLRKLNIPSTTLEIAKFLRIRFDGLHWYDKNMFLDIACFFKGEKRDNVERLLEAFGFNSRFGINRLIDKSLIIEEEGIITMRDFLQKMGREIVVEEKQSQQQQSRLWTIDGFRNALACNRGNENVEAIVVQLNEEICSVVAINISPKAFVPMHKLRCLQIHHPVHFPMGLEFLPNSIKYLNWSYYPLNYLPFNYNLEGLVELHLHGSQLEELIWDKPLNLKRIFLGYSYSLIRISALAKAPNLGVIVLQYCIRLVEIGPSMENLTRLTRLCLRGCLCLTHLPEIPSTIKELELSESGLKQLPSTLGRLTHLKQLSFEFCNNLESLPSSICQLISLERLNLSKCWSLKQLPENFGNLESLEQLDASYSGLVELPLSIQNMKNLTVLNLIGCKHLESVPKFSSNLEVLKDSTTRSRCSIDSCCFRL